jgi:hypothetical protein
VAFVKQWTSLVQPQHSDEGSNSSGGSPIRSLLAEFVKERVIPFDSSTGKKLNKSLGQKVSIILCCVVNLLVLNLPTIPL